jgi:predicted aspartyl protease
MSYPYLTNYYPPIPALEIRIGYPTEALATGPLEAIVDTGADGTLIPQALLDDIGAPLVDEVRMRSQWGESRSATLFAVDVGIGDLLLPDVEVVGDEAGEEIILGRNVLNRLKLLLDGPRERTEIPRR